MGFLEPQAKHISFATNRNPVPLLLRGAFSKSMAAQSAY
jgi:hypothetical protein